MVRRCKLNDFNSPLVVDLQKNFSNMSGNHDLDENSFDFDWTDSTFDYSGRESPICFPDNNSDCSPMPEMDSEHCRQQTAQFQMPVHLPSLDESYLSLLNEINSESN